MTERIALIRTSGRSQFRTCRRLWAWSNALRDNRVPREPALPLWIGSGFHFMLEDFHGHSIYGTAIGAWDAYVGACRRSPHVELPDDWQEGNLLGREMARYYVEWLKGRDPLTTYVHNGIPQVEVRIEFEILTDLAAKYGYDKVIYQCTLDRVIIDEYEGLWIQEYKTAIRFKWYHTLTDPQVSSYTWIGNVLYGKPIQGVIYQQHKKIFPNAPRILSSGKISTAESQNTTRRLYREALIDLYTSVEKAPKANVNCLNILAEQETEDRDAFIRRDRIERNEHQLQAEGEKVLMELEDMLNPDLPLYPSPGDHCGWCAFQVPCVSLDDGSDWKAALEDMSKPRTEDDESWRPYLRPPVQLQQNQ